MYNNFVLNPPIIKAFSPWSVTLVLYKNSSRSPSIQLNQMASGSLPFPNFTNRSRDSWRKCAKLILWVYNISPRGERGKEKEKERERERLNGAISWPRHCPFTPDIPMSQPPHLLKSLLDSSPPPPKPGTPLMKGGGRGKLGHTLTPLFDVYVQAN